MNGVINIITKHAEDTQGGLLAGGGGSKENGFGALRYGKKLAEDTYGRAYIKGFLRDEFTPNKPTNGSADWNQFQGGFRVDSMLSAQDNLMLQGNAYKGQPNQTLETFVSPALINDNVNTSGWNLTSKFNHRLSSTADYSLQFYYDHYQRQEYLFHNVRDTLDLDFQNTFAYGDQHNIIWGMGYRYTDDSFINQPLATLTPNSRGTQLYSAFVQDEISLFNDALLLTLGSKFEHNDYTGFQIQPSASLMWTPKSGHKLWASISRAVRTPSRTEANSNYLLGIIPSNSQIIRYRFQSTSSLRALAPINPNNNSVISWAIVSCSITIYLGTLRAFYNDYTRLRSVAQEMPVYENGALNYPWYTTTLVKEVLMDLKCPAFGKCSIGGDGI